MQTTVYLPVVSVVSDRLEEVGGYSPEILVKGSNLGSPNSEVLAPTLDGLLQITRGLIEKLSLLTQVTTSDLREALQIHSLLDVEGNRKEKVEMNVTTDTTFKHPEVIWGNTAELPEQFLETMHRIFTSELHWEGGGDEKNVLGGANEE
ncbi:hypothetical protein [Luteolibacter soli]|uniref:Uncharacterized protein n=1 Tax=Luteolibacter soli TaxID=3135280 RepID=A0ABU9AZU3_9BACT